MIGRVLPGDLTAQTRFTMTYIEDLLRGFGRRPADLKLLVAYFVSDGSPAVTQSFHRDPRRLDRRPACRR